VLNKAILALALFSGLATAKDWMLQESSITYHISHPLHPTEGVSHAARGKGVCSGGQCEFIIAAPVKSFDSGDSNRDLHMFTGCARSAVSAGPGAYPIA
jgi:hypothetical protein